ncbi:uncharacterized protein CCR75_003568 [Bremia lactucae]|uniref:Uncharacterized protein n=1 Tax=Bremia lactucae TaxID=4779 RepID=A0A976IDL0_BRELC|nr:hypothetical protein CCR75_003568 [Bremia lactucae]
MWLFHREITGFGVSGCVLASEGELRRNERCGTQRICLQNQADRVAESSVNPPEVHVRVTEKGLAPTISTRVQDVSSRISGGAVTHPVLSASPDGVPIPALKPLWVTVSRRCRTNRRGTVKAITTRRATGSTQFAALADPDEELCDTGRTGMANITPRSDEERFAAQEVEPLSAPVYSPEVQLRNLQSLPPQVPSTPQLVALKPKERAEARSILQEADSLKEQLMDMPAETELASVTEYSIQQVLRLRHVATPAPGNCLALAVVQELANDDLAQVETILNRAAPCVKREFKYTGPLDMTDQFDHAERLKTLVNVRQGWMATSIKESTKKN